MERERDKLIGSTRYKLEEVSKRELAVKKQVQKTGALKQQIESLEMENERLQQQLSDMHEMYNGLESKLQNRDSTDQRLTLELNRHKIRSIELSNKLKFAIEGH